MNLNLSILDNGKRVFRQPLELEAGRSTQRVEALLKATELGCEIPGVLFELGFAMIKMRRWEEAKNELELYEELDPERAQSRSSSGRPALR